MLDHKQDCHLCDSLQQRSFWLGQKRSWYWQFLDSSTLNCQALPHFPRGKAAMPNLSPHYLIWNAPVNLPQILPASLSGISQAFCLAHITSLNVIVHSALSPCPRPSKPVSGDEGKCPTSLPLSSQGHHAQTQGQETPGLCYPNRARIEPLHTGFPEKQGPPDP